jgi:NADPH:quinone reductase-like Zn-dependent oxidoreductase
MKAIVQNSYGSPDQLELKEIPMPVINDDQVLVRVHAASLNSGDYFSVMGSPWVARLSVGFPRPKDYILGWDAAGRVEAGKVAPVIDRTYPLSKVPEALGYLGQGHARGKVVITMD